MSVLFAVGSIGRLELPNRFICSATYEGMAEESGAVRNELIKRYATLAKGGVGLIITGHMYVQPSGRAYKLQTGIHNDRMVEGLTKLVDTVHQIGGKIAFQLAHCGRQTTKAMAGQTPIAPSRQGRDPINFVKPREMTAQEIEDTILAFGAAAGRAMEAGADAIQLHAAHGYLISEFLSPFFNIRKDSWGGSDANRFRFLKAVYGEVRKHLPKGYPVLVKLNANDHTPREGVTPGVALNYARWLAEMGVDGLELSCGTTNYSYMNMCRGEVPTEEIVKSLSWWERPFARRMIGKLEGRYDLEEGYNLGAAKVIKPALDGAPLILVGGMRSVARMEEALKNGHADFISMSRPFIREPFLVNKIKDDKMTKVSCLSCNRCLAAVPNELPVYCYNKKFPK